MSLFRFHTVSRDVCLFTLRLVTPYVALALVRRGCHERHLVPDVRIDDV